MLFRCYIEGSADLFFIVRGKKPRRARLNAVAFLDFFGLPISGLRLEAVHAHDLLFRCVVKFPDAPHQSPTILMDGKDNAKARFKITKFLRHFGMLPDHLCVERWRKSSKQILLDKLL